MGSIGSAIGGIAGGLLGKKASDNAADAQVEAAQIAAAQFAPYSISSPLGAFNVDRRRKQIDAELSSTAQAMLRTFEGEAGASLEEATAERLGILDQLAARGEEDARRFTTERLFAAGALGTHSGTRQIGEVERAIQDARLGRMLSARDMAFNERQGAFGNALALYQLPTTLASASLNRNPAAAISAMGYQNAASTRGNFQLGAANAIGQGIGGLIDNTDWGGIGDSISGIFGGGGGAFSTDYGSMFI